MKNFDNCDLWQFPARIDLSFDSTVCVGKFHKKPSLALTVGLSRHPIILQWPWLPIENNMTRKLSGLKTEEP